MTKVIKLPKDRLGNAYYPATVTDAIVHPTKKQSLTEIIDSLSSGVEDGSITMQKLSNDVLEAINKEIPSNYITEDILTSKGYATETFVTTKIAEAKLSGEEVDLTGYATKEDLTNLATKDEIPSLTGYATESWVKEQKYLTEHQDLSGKQDKIADLETIRTGAALGASALQSIPTEYVTETELSSKGYLTEHQDISGKQDKISDLNTIRQNALKGSTALQSVPDEYITEEELLAKGYITLADVPKSDVGVSEEWVEQQGFLKEIPEEYAKKSDIPSVSGLASEQWVKDQKYLTEHQDLSGKQDVISDLADIRANAAKGASALQSVPSEYITESELNAKNYLTSIPSEYITETELTNKGYVTSASIPTKTSLLTNDSGFITLLKTVMSQSLIGSGNVDFTDSINAAAAEAVTKAVNATNIESIKFKGILNVWSDFTKLKSLMDSIQVGEVFFCLPSLNDDVMGCMPRETSWRDLPIPTSLSNAVDDVEKYVKECTGDVEDLSPINIYGARAPYESLGMDFDESPVSNITAIRKIGYYPMLLTLDEDVWKTMSFREGDMFCIAKMNYKITGIPLIDSLEIPVVLCFTWQIGSANANKYASYNSLIHRWAPSANQCLKTGVYPWVTLNVPVANNAYTLFVESSTNRDDNGFYTIKQTAYGRQSDDAIYERMLVAKQSYLEYYVPALSSAISLLENSTTLTCEWDPSDYVCIAYYNGDNKLTHWDLHVIQTMVDNTTAIVNEDNTIQFSSDFCNTVEGKVSLCIVNSVTPGPNGRSYPLSYKSTTVGSTKTTETTETAMTALSILGDFMDNPNTPWKMTSDAFTSRGGGDANWCLDSGVYPWVVVNVPTGNDGAFTLVVHKTASPDGGGYYTIDQTAYGRQGEETMYVYKRLLFYKPATPGTDEVDILENGAAWHKINNSNSGGLNITTENGLLSNIKIGYEPGTNVNSIAAQPGSHHCIVDGKGIGYANINIVSHWNNTHNVTITVVSNHGGIITTYVASAEDIPNDVVRVPGFNNITTWATTNTRTDYIDKTAIIPSVRNNTLAPVLVSKTEFISKYGFDPTNYTNLADYFTAMTDIGLVSNTYINGYGLCEVELIEQEDTYDLCYSFEKAKGVTNTDVAAGNYTDLQIKTIFGVPFILLGDSLVIREQVYTVSMLSNYKKVYINWSENATLNTITIELKDDNYEITKNTFNIS